MTEQTNMDRAREWWAGGLTPEHEATDDYDEDVMRQVAALLDAAEERGRVAEREAVLPLLRRARDWVSEGLCYADCNKRASARLERGVSELCAAIRAMGAK